MWALVGFATAGGSGGAGGREGAVIVGWHVEIPRVSVSLLDVYARTPLCRGT